ncbi:bifunctional methionine sulfoxide reductase B/A protein [Sulfurimonas sp. HSL-3221]|nr:bifunctional methionine sulfoxide reductase B/A protein [Sulfurimonas sp. HSL-3221]UFS63781.1 bifunctional methionine sulfoxide reductase B/A protein [Sulfurimonas sp. HSL-3221]
MTPQEEAVIVHKATERPYSGELLHNKAKGTYVCKRCGAKLYRSEDKFDSHCGWPSFDDEIPGAVKRIPDPDGYRTEIICANCGAHLGHVFSGEHLTQKNLRHCVNSISMEFIPEKKVAYFAGGCFWGVEYYIEKIPGVTSVVSGYMGGNMPDPTYRDVSSGRTGYLETVAVTYDPSKVDYKTLAKTFFDIHDPTQKGRQGPDIGSQYQSAVFYNDLKEKMIAEALIAQLVKNGYNVQTELLEASAFQKAEAYHQDYYMRHHKQPYCHGFVDRFKDKD